MKDTFIVLMAFRFEEDILGISLVDMEGALQSQSGSTESSTIVALEGHCYSNCGYYFVMLLMVFYTFLVMPVLETS